MHHGVRHWEKKLNRTAKSRDGLLRGLMTQLVQHEQIQTTLPKAKFLLHEMERLVNMAKKASDSDLKIIQRTLFTPEITAAKLVHVLAKRYADIPGGYLRILKNGTRSSGSDRAPLAIIEFVGNAKDVIYHSGNQSTSILEKQLKEIESKKYIKHVVKLVHPETGAAVEVTKLIERQDLSGKVKQLLTRQEISIVKKLEKFSRSKKMFKHARQADEQAEKTIPSIQDGQQGRVLPPKGRTREILASGSYKIRHAAIKPAGPSNFAAASSASQAQAGESSKDAKAKDAKPISSKAASSLFGGSFWKRFGL